MIKAKKSLSQNFLIDKNILEKITNITKITNKIVLEVGPGTGNLTSYILKKNPKKLFVIEKDNQLAIDLEKKFNNQISIIHEDVLKIDETTFFKDKLIVFGNGDYPKSQYVLINIENGDIENQILYEFWIKKIDYIGNFFLVNAQPQKNSKFLHFDIGSQAENYLIKIDINGKVM